jgi:hypothetical protein
LHSLKQKEEKMGKSISIEELEAADAKFAKYLADRRIEITATATDTRKKMDSAIEKFYKDGGWNDRKPVCSAEYIDVQNVSEWSLANVNKILDAVGGAIFGSKNPIPGLKLSPDVKAGTNNVLNAVGGLQMLALSKAFSAVQGILEAFTVKSSTSITMNSKIEVVTPGLTIFVYTNANNFQQKSFFNNTLISQYFFMIDVYTSAKQLGDYAKFQDLQLFEEEKASLRLIARKIINTMSELEDLDKLDQIAKQLDGIYARLEVITEKADELSKEEAANHRELAKQARLRLTKASTAKS